MVHPSHWLDWTCDLIALGGAAWLLCASSESCYTFGRMNPAVLIASLVLGATGVRLLWRTWARRVHGTHAAPLRPDV
jgi:hypothetical protein